VETADARKTLRANAQAKIGGGVVRITMEQCLLERGFFGMVKKRQKR